MNKGGGPRVSHRARTKICLIYVLFDLAGVSSSGRLHRRTPMGDAWRLLDRWDSVAMHGAARSSASVATMGKSMVKSEAEKVIEGEIGGQAMALGVFKSMGNWLGVSRFVAAVCKRGRQHT